MKKTMILAAAVALVISAFAAVSHASPRTNNPDDVRSSGPGPFGANGGSQVQSPGNRPMPPIVPQGPHDIWPPTGVR